MSLKWDDSLTLGIDELDRQHKSLIESFQKLSESVQDGSSEEEVKKLTQFLFGYAQVHFATEDDYMVKYNYPNIDIQRTEHSQFTRDSNEFRQRIEQEGATRGLAIEITGKLIRWIIQHIRNHDREMYEYFKTRIEAEGNRAAPEEY